MSGHVDGRNERKVTSQNSILTAACRLIDEKGINGFSMRELAASAGVSAATLYNNFDSREAIIKACFERALSVLRPQFDSLRNTRDLGSLCDAISKSVDILCSSLSGAMFLKFTQDPSLANLNMGEHHATDRVVLELDMAVLRGELSQDVDIDELRSVVEAVIFTAMRLEALGAISADERRRRIASGLRLVLRSSATELGCSSLMSNSVPK